MASVSGFVIGGLWYAPFLFGKRWMVDNGFKDEDSKEGTEKVMGGALVFSIVSVIFLGLITQVHPGLMSGIHVGLFISVGLISTSMAVNYLFERKPLSLFLINAGNQLVTYIVMGAILGGWQ
ncbi:MAG: hypothetical protein ACI81S_001520 [Sphingobacteriales bacterium]